MGTLANSILKGVEDAKKLKKIIQSAANNAVKKSVSDEEEEALRRDSIANRSRAGIGFSNYSSPEYLESVKKKKEEEALADPLGLKTMPISNAAGPQNRTDVAKAIQARDERLEREARILAANQLAESVGWANVGNEKVYKTPFSPLPDPNKVHTLQNGQQVTARANKALAPGLYGIKPDEYVQAMGAIDKYNTKPEMSAESQEFLKKYHPEKNGQVPTEEEIQAKAAGMAMPEMREYVYAANAMLNDYEAVQEALSTYQKPPKATDGVLSDETRNFLQKNFGEKYQRGELPTADEIEAWAEGQTFDREGLEWLYGTSDEIEKVQASHNALLEENKKTPYAEAIKLLGVDAEQYAGLDAADYYERYGNLYGSEHNSKKNPYYDAEGPLKVTQEQMEAWSQRPISHTTQDEQFDLVRWGTMTQEEKDAYNTILREYGEEAAKNYLQAKEGELNRRVTQEEQLEHGKQAMKHPFLASVVNPLERIGGAVSQGELWLEELVTGEAPDEYDLRRLGTRRADSTVANVGLKIENNVDGFAGQALSFGYQTVMSLADMGANMLAFGPLGAAGTGAAMGLSAAASTYNNVIDRGGDHDTANAMAGVAGISEMLFEKFSIEGVWKIAKGGGLGSAVKNVMRQMGIEASEETATEIANQIADRMLMGDLSLYEQQGAGAVAQEIALAGLGGALMGGLGGGGAQIAHGVTSHFANTREDNLLKEAAEARAEQQIAEQKDQAMLESLPADMPVQETAAPEYAKKPENEDADTATVREESRQASAQEAQSRDQEAQRHEAQQQERVRQNETQAAEMQEKATENASKAAQADSVSKAQAENAKAANEAKKQDKQRALMQFKQKQEAVAMNRDGMNEPVTVTGVDHVENGTVYMTVTDANGVERVESADEMSFSSDVGELLASDNIDRLDDRGVAAYIDNYNAELAAVKQYERAFVGVYERARAGMNYRDAVTNSVFAQNYLTQEAASQAFLAGTARFNTDQASKQQKRQKFQDPVLNAMNKMAGGKIFMVDSLPGNSMYDKSTGNIYIAKDAQKGAYAYYAMHELVHKLKHESPDYWSKFHEMVEDELLVHDVDIDAEMAHVRENYKAQGIELDAEGALEEVIANHAPALLQDRAVLEKMVAKDRTLMEKIREWFEGFMDKLHNAMVESGEAMSDLKSWHNIDMLKGDSAQLMQMYDCLVEALESTKGEQKRDVPETNDVKWSLAPGGKLANNGIDRDMPDAERAEVLRNMEIQTVPMVELSSEAQTLVEQLRKGGMGRDSIKKAIMSLPEYKAISGVDLHSDSITVPFRFSNGSLDETLKKMEVNGRFDFSQAQRFVELLGNLSEQVKKATAIEVHTDRYLHRVYDTTKIENYGAMLGIAQNGNTEIPVLYELKNFKGNEKDKLYLVATFEETKKGPMQGRGYADSSANAAPTNTGTYIVSDYLRNINSSAGRLLKYFPNELMSDAQIQSAEIARLEQERYTLTEKIGVGNIDLKDGKPVQQSQIDEIDRQIAEIRNGTIKHSLREDSAGNTLTEEQQAYFADSKVRDENGKLMVMYHGTPNGNYDRFRSGTYFTPMKDYADVYQSPNASSISVKRNADNPQTYQVYLNMEKPFDTRNAKERRIFMNEYYRKYGTGAPLSESGLPDWTDGMDLQEFIEEMGYDYDGLILDEGGVPDGNGGVKSRGLSYVIFDPAQAKLVDNSLPTEDARFRWSLRESDTTVQDELTTLKELFHLTSAHRMTDKEAVRMARKVKAAAQSTMGTEELAGKLKHIYDYVERGGKNASMEEVDSELNAVAEEIMATSRTLDYEHEERMQPIRDYFRRKNIRLSDYQRSEAANKVGSIGEYRRMVFGRVKLANTGLPLETAWSELSDLDAELFPPDAKETDMPVLLLDAVDAMAPVYLNDSGLNSMEAAQWLTGEMNKAYLALSGVQAAAKEQEQLRISLKQYRKLTERFATEHKAAFDEAMVKVKANMDEEKRKQLEEAEKQYRLDVLNARADAKAEYKDEIARVKADADAKIAKMKDKLGEAKAKYRDKQNEKYKGWRKEYRTAQSEKYKEFRDAYREAMKKKDKEWREQYREDRKETERKQRYRGQITRMMNELVKLLEHPTDKKHVQDGLRDAVLEFCHNIDLGSSNKATRSLQSRITSLVKAMEDAQKGTEAGNNQYLIDPDLLDTMKTFAEQVKTLGSMNELTADQMREMRNLVRGVAHIVKTADQMFVANRKMRISDAAMNSMDELSRKKDKKKREGFLGKVDELMNNGMLDSFRAFDRFGTTARMMYQNLRDGFDVKVRCIAQANDYVQDHMDGADKDIAKGKKAKKTTYQVRGGEIELTKAQVMELYCLSKRKAARKHLYNGGITTDDHVSMVRITEADVRNITSTLTDGERKLADALQMFLETECSKWGNETSMTLHGYRKFGEKGYYPMRVDDGSIDTKVTESGKAENLWAMVNPGFGKELSDKANQPLRIGDIFDTFSRHVDSMSNYRAYAAPIADLLRWYNWKPYGEQGIKTMLTQKFGVTGREYIPNLIRDLNMQSKAGYTPGIAEGFTKNAKAAAVGANIRVVIQQPTAIARAAVMMNPKYIAQGEAMTPKRMKECGNLAKQYCPIAKWKSMGYYETHMGKGLRDLMFGGQGVLEKASDIGMKPAGWADEATWAALWNACEKETRDLHPELKGEALYEATGKRLGEIIDYTQVVDTPFHRSQLMRSKNSTVQMATAFMSEPTKTYNMLQASIARWAENRRDPVARAQVGRTLLVFVATGVLNAAAQSVIDAMRDDDDEEKLLEKYMQAFGGNVLDNLNAVALLPYASDIISMMQGYEPSRMDMQMVQKVIDVFKELFDGKPSDWSKHKWARKVLSAVSYATGVPLENLYRDATSLYNTVVMQFGGKPLPNQHQTANEKMAYDNMYDALMDGNQKKWSRIEGTIKAWEKPKSNSDIDTGIGKLLAEDDERIARAWEAKSAGKASEVSRIRKEIVTDLAKSGVLGTERLGEIVDKAINTYGSKVTPKEEKPVDTEKALNVKMYTTKDAANAVRGIADGTTSLADAKAIMSELVADSEAKDPQKSVRSSVLGEVKKDYLEAAKSGNTRKASSLGNAMKELFGTTQTDMDKWVTDSYADDLRTAVDANNVGNAKNIMAKLRARGLDDYDIQDRLSKYRQQYIDAVKSGNHTKANQIKRTLMALGLKYNSGDPMYKDSTFEGWLK